MVYILFQVRAKFTVDDYSHYLFTPCILTQWVLGLFRYDLEGGKFCSHDFKSRIFLWNATAYLCAHMCVCIYAVYCVYNRSVEYCN